MSLKKLLSGVIVGGILLVPAFSSLAAAESIAFAESVCVIPVLDETFDAAENLLISGEDADGAVLYSSFDESIAMVSEDGLVTATGYGVTTIVAALALDDTVSTSMDVAVFPLFGTFSGTKYIEAMDCEIAIDITLYEDGTFAYYRGPMYVALAGGGESEALEDDGTWEMEGMEIIFDSEALGEYTMTFAMDGIAGALTGKLPTGGAATEMELTREIEEETGEAAGEDETEMESGVETAGLTEAESGEPEGAGEGTGTEAE